MKVFDFDNTIYHGESSIDFSIFMIRKNRRIILYLPTIFICLVKYKLCLVDKVKLEKTINDFLKAKYPGWEQTSYNKRILGLIKRDDVIMTASPSFLVHGIQERLNTRNIICTEVDPDKKEMTYFNFGENKLRRYKKLYGDRKIDCLFTDSYNDKAIMDISEKVYIVRKGRIRRLKTS